MPRAAASSPEEAEDLSEVQAAAARARAEAELAEARAAAARAKAELAAARAGRAVEGTASEAASGGVAAGPAPAPAAAPPGGLEPAVPPVVTLYSGDEERPAQLLLSAEGMAFFSMLARLEDVQIFGNRTALDALLRATLNGLWQFAQMGRAARDGDLKELPADLLRDVEEAGTAVTPEAMASALAPRVVEDGPRQGGDWRPLAKALGRVQRLPEIVEKAVAWEQLFPDPMARATGMTREEAKEVTLAFFRSRALEKCADWTDQELDAAERLAQRDERLRRVFTRVEIVRKEVAETFTGAAWLPVALLAVLLAASWCVFCSNPGGGGGDAPLLMDDSSLQGLPLLTLEK